MIPVQLEDIEELRAWGMGLEKFCERCFFCKTPTRTWHLPSNTPVCETCAQQRQVADLPAPDQAPQVSEPS